MIDYCMPGATQAPDRDREVLALANALWRMVDTYAEEGHDAFNQPSMVYKAIVVLRSIKHDACIKRYGERD